MGFNSGFKGLKKSYFCIIGSILLASSSQKRTVLHQNLQKALGLSVLFFCPPFSIYLFLTTQIFKNFRCVRKIAKKQLLASSCLSIFPSDRPHGTTRFPRDVFLENLNLRVFLKYVEKLPISLKSDNNNGFFT